MIGEGYDWAQQYSVSSGDFVGAMPVGMQSRGDTDLPAPVAVTSAERSEEPAPFVAPILNSGTTEQSAEGQIVKSMVFATGSGAPLSLG